MQSSNGSSEWSFARSIVLAAALAGGCYAGVGYAEDGYDDAPPAAIVTTTEPFYYEGHPNYWYHGHWHYREGSRWRRYRSEPEPMRQWRMGRAPGQPQPGPMRGRAPHDGEEGPPARPLPSPR